MSDIPPNKKLRAVEFVLVIFVAFAPPIFKSTFLYLTGDGGQSYSNASLNAGYFTEIISQLSSLTVLAYVLFRQGRSLAKIGFLFAWLDLLQAVLLVVIVYVAAYIWSYGTVYLYYFVTKSVPSVRPRNVEFLNVGVTLPSLIFVLLNPFNEELIVRAFTISEVEYLTRSSIIAVIVSVALQTSYHLYQGPFAAWSYVPIFFIFSLYYVKWRRITPIILAHLFFDLTALLARG